MWHYDDYGHSVVLTIGICDVARWISGCIR